MVKLAKIIFLLFLNFLISQIPSERLFVTMQMTDQVGVINTENSSVNQYIASDMEEIDSEISCMILEESTCGFVEGCEWSMGMCMGTIDASGIDTPHFIVMDEELGYWFLTTMTSGYVAQYSLVDNHLIDSFYVGDAPALLTIDTVRKKVYCSRTMPMSGMGMGDMMPSSESNKIQALDYGPSGLSESNISDYEIDSPAPHAIAISEDGNEIFTASNTTDWLYKINTITEEITGVVMDLNINNLSGQVIQRLKPIQCLSIGNKLFVTCSAGSWFNSFTGENSVIPGQLQMWNSDTMELIDFIELGNYTNPWHIKESPVDDVIYVSLGGDSEYETEGVASVSFTDNMLSLEWLTTNPIFNTLHGVDVSSDGEKIYVSARGDGFIHILNSSGVYLESISVGMMSMPGGICITKKGLPILGDSNNNKIINVVDIIKILNFVIMDDILLSPYEIFASDLTLDGVIDITDVVSIVDLIINNE